MVVFRRSSAAANALAQRRLSQIEQGVEILGTMFADLNPEQAERDGKPLAATLGMRTPGTPLSSSM